MGKSKSQSCAIYVHEGNEVSTGWERYAPYFLFFSHAYHWKTRCSLGSIHACHLQSFQGNPGVPEWPQPQLSWRWAEKEKTFAITSPDHQAMLRRFRPVDWPGEMRVRRSSMRMSFCPAVGRFKIPAVHLHQVEQTYHFFRPQGVDSCPCQWLGLCGSSWPQEKEKNLGPRNNKTSRVDLCR